MEDDKKEAFGELRENARKYIYTIMFDDEYTPEKYDEKLAKAQEDKSKLYTDYSDEIFDINIMHLIQGYSSFGKDFLVAAISQDLDSAVAMFESATQNVLDMTAQIEAFQESLHQAVEAKRLSEKAKDSKENS